MLYRRHDVDEETPVQYVGVYVTKWHPEWGEPTAMFAAVEGEEGDLLEAAPAMLEALKDLVFTASVLWNEVKPIKDTEAMTVTHPVIERAKTIIAEIAEQEQSDA